MATQHATRSAGTRDLDLAIATLADLYDYLIEHSEGTLDNRNVEGMVADALCHAVQARRR